MDGNAKIQGIVIRWAADLEQTMAEGTMYRDGLMGALQQTYPMTHRDDLPDYIFGLVVSELARSYAAQSLIPARRDRDDERTSAIGLLQAAAREYIGATEAQSRSHAFWADVIADVGMPAPPDGWNKGPLRWLTVDEVYELQVFVESM